MVKLDPKYLPDGSPYIEPPMFNITWDGDKTDKQVIEMPEEGGTLVKISDEIPSNIATDFLGSQLTVTERGEVMEPIQIDSSYIYTVPGAVTITGMVYIVYDSDTLLANTPEEFRLDFTNGVYFMYGTDPTDETYSAYVSNFVGASVIHKLDSKYLPDINITPESLGLSAVAASGDYNDLNNKPVVYNKTESDTTFETKTDASAKLREAKNYTDNNISSLSTVAKSGNYNDLTNRPFLSTVAKSGDYNDLNNKPSLSAVATSGNYNDLTNKPTIPTVPTVDQTYQSTSTKAQSGTAVAQALIDYVPKVDDSLLRAPVTCLLGAYGGYPNIHYFYVVSDDYTVGKVIEDIDRYSGTIPRRDSRGNLFTGVPVDDADCTNKKYVDDLVGDIETLLGGI